MITKRQLSSKGDGYMFLENSYLIYLSAMSLYHNIVVITLYFTSMLMGNIGEDYPHLITDGAVVNQV